MRRTMAFRRVDLEGRTIFVVLHTEEAPSDEEWGAWTSMLEEHARSTAWQLGQSGNLVLTDGGAPSTAQRTAVNVIVAQGKTTPWVAVMTESTLVRTVLRGLSIFNPRLRPFAPSQGEEAAEHLQLRRSREALPQLLRACQELEAEAFRPGQIASLQAFARACANGSG